jgi:hypothetical protein
MKRSRNGTSLLVAAMFLSLVSSSCSSGPGNAPDGEVAVRTNSGVNDANAAPVDNDDGFFIIQWTLKIGHVRRQTVRQPAPTTSPSTQRATK